MSIITSSELIIKGEIKVFLNDEEFKISEEKETNNNHESKDMVQTQELKEDVISPTAPLINESRELIVENIPANLSNEKIYEIFFIYGDISKLEIKRKEVRNN